MSEFECANGHLMSSRMQGTCQWTRIRARVLNRFSPGLQHILREVPFCDIEEVSGDLLVVCCEPGVRRDVLALLVQHGDVNLVQECGLGIARMDGKSAGQLAAEEEAAYQAARERDLEERSRLPEDEDGEAEG